MVASSTVDVPLSDAAAMSGCPGAAGAAVSTESDDGDVVVPTFPAGSVMTAVSDHVPSVRVGRSHVVTATETVNVHVAVVAPFDAVTVTRSPTSCPGTETAGVESLVTLSVADAPVSEADSRSTAGRDGADESTTRLNGVPAALVLPAVSEIAPDTDHVPSVSAGRSHDEAAGTV